MSVKYLTPPYVQEDGTIVTFYLADTEAERPSNLPVGTLCFTKATNKLWVVNAADAWQEVGGAAGGGGEHPDLAAHNTLGLATQTELDDGLAAKADTHAHPYEASGAVTTHEQAANPHATYLTQAEGDSLYSGTGHSHGGGSSPWTLAIKTTDQSNNTTTLADDTVLQFTPIANTQYSIRLRAFFLTNATADLKYRMVHTGTTTRVRRKVKRTATSDTAQTLELKTAFDAADVVLSTTGLNPWLEEDIILQVGATPGVVKLQFAQVTSNAGPTTCLEGSYIEYAVS